MIRRISIFIAVFISGFSLGYFFCKQTFIPKAQESLVAITELTNSQLIKIESLNLRALLTLSNEKNSNDNESFNKTICRHMAAKIKLIASNKVELPHGTEEDVRAAEGFIRAQPKIYNCYAVYQ
ncbi:hypothetical protein R0381_003438 [Jeongeupia wiesaeckerbachi]|uniref:hypothetical protein n=1 Tax=Jeongeupia wiesaeckerbachi TaxID=3051218 RepID=UPI003D801340